MRSCHVFLAAAIIEYGVAIYRFYGHFVRGMPFPTRFAPYGWLALAAVFSVSAIQSYRTNLQASRYKQGLCDRCGYDLRASPGRCPECGHLPVTALEAES
jgi:hypothetical protein